MKGSTILKKVLPIVIVLLLIVGVAITVTAVKKNAGKASVITGKDDVYLSVRETVNGKEYTYSISKNDLYTELFDSIGLSSAITMSNIDILKDKKNDEGVSIWDSITEDEIKEQIAKDCYGEDVDVDDLTEDEKADLEKKFLNTMYIGYGYDASNMYTDDIMNHYRLVLGKKAYAKYALAKEIADAPSDDPYFSDDDIEDYYDDHYSSSFYGILVGFSSSANVSLALQQQRVINSTFWKHLTLKQNDENQNYETETGEALTAFEVIQTVINLYNMMNPTKMLVEGTATYDEETKTYVVADGDYAIVDHSAEYDNAKAAIEALEVVKTEGFDHDEVIALIATAQEKVEALSGGSTSTLIENLQKLNALVSGEDSEGNPETVYDTLIEGIQEFAFKAYVFNLDNVDSPLYFDYTSLYDYDSNLPSKFSSNYAVYTPFISTNDSSALWYTKSSLSSNSVYYVFVKLAELDSPALADVKDEIIEKLTEDKLTDSYMETKMAELREEYNIKFFNKDLDNSYIESMKSNYSVEHKANKKKSSTAVFKTDLKEYSADDLFNYMEKTSGLSTAISDIAYQRLLNNPLFNTYKDMETGKWIGDKGKETRDSITAQVENQRLYFLSGSYSSYGYSPQTMTWEEFLYQLNGVKSEYELADMILYSTISSDYVKKALDFAETKGEGVEAEFVMSYSDALNSDIWKLVEEKMQGIIEDYFSCYGEHLLVSVYENIKAEVAGSDPVDPTDDNTTEVQWTDEQKQLAKELLNEVQEYLLSASGTYSAKLDAIVSAFNAAPYAVVDPDTNEYIDVCDSNGNLYKYYLELGDIKIDLAKYKSAGLCLKHETLSSFGAGEMVEQFENAAKEIWAADMEKGLTDNITIYKNSEGDYNIETKFGYHLYVNLGSSLLTTYKQAVVDANGEPTGEEVDATLPSLYDVRNYIMHQLVEAIDTTDMSDEEKAKVEELDEKIHDLITSEVSTAISTYYSVVSSEITGSYFSAILQQNEVKGLLGSSTINSSQFEISDVTKFIDASFENVYEANLKYLNSGDENLFDITGAFSK